MASIPGWPPRRPPMGRRWSRELAGGLTWVRVGPKEKMLTRGCSPKKGVVPGAFCPSETCVYGYNVWCRTAAAIGSLRLGTQPLPLAAEIYQGAEPLWSLFDARQRAQRLPTVIP